MPDASLDPSAVSLLEASNESDFTLKEAEPRLKGLPQEVLDQIFNDVVIPGEGKQESMGLFLMNNRLLYSVLAILLKKNAWVHEFLVGPDPNKLVLFDHTASLFYTGSFHRE